MGVVAMFVWMVLLAAGGVGKAAVDAPAPLGLALTLLFYGSIGATGGIVAGRLAARPRLGALVGGVTMVVLTSELIVGGSVSASFAAVQIGLAVFIAGWVSTRHRRRSGMRGGATT